MINALAYLNRVKVGLSNEGYNKFLEIMKEFKQQVLTTDQASYNHSCELIVNNCGVGD